MYRMNRSNKKRLSGKTLYVLLAASLVLCVVTISMVAVMLSRENRFKAYIRDFSKSTSNAYSRGYITATVDGINRQITGDSIHSVYALIVNCRGVKLQERPQSEPQVVLDFGDGSKMEFWESKLENATNNREYGLLIYYVNQAGEPYCYDTDRLDIDRVKLLVRRKVDMLQPADKKEG